MRNELLIFVPTYNERENVEALLRQLLELNLAADILFLDDHSPDGTGVLLDELAARHSNVAVIHRTGKLGIGSAHVAGIRWAYEKNYQMLVTMDCDFTHAPEYIRDLLALVDKADVVIGSRYLQSESLATWNPYRKLLTKLGHAFTRFFLKMPYDATGAFRLYRLDRIPAYFLDPVQSHGYSFFFESLYLLHLNGFRIMEVPTHLPARVYGHSKMRLKDAIFSVTHLVHIYFTVLINRERFEIAEPYQKPGNGAVLRDPQGWAAYWSHKDKPLNLVYDLIAAFYRKFIIKPSLNRFILKYFDRSSRLLHAGCGGGQVDQDVGKAIGISALDISPEALSIYRKSNKHYRELIHGSIFAIPGGRESYDGIYNLGVLEHFTEEEIGQILAEFHRVLKPEGKVVLFWPPEFGLSVIFLKVVHLILNRVLKKEIALHPPEITRIRSRRQVAQILMRSGFSLLEYRFGPRDLFTYVVLVAAKAAPVAHGNAAQDLARPAVPIHASATEAPAPKASLLSAKAWLSITGWVLLGLWALWWGLSFENHVLVFGKMTLVPVWHLLGLDFLHNYLGSIAWLSGRDPYLYFFGDDRGLYAYPPIVLPMFGWSAWVSFPTAVIIFACVIAAITAVAAFLSLHFRRFAGLPDLPAALSAGAVLLSLPVVFAMERGQCDALVLMLLLVAAWAMVRGKGLDWDLLAGIALAVALWIKVYPGILFLAPLALRRYRVFAIAVLASGVIGAAAMGLTFEWLDSLANSQTARVGPIGELKDWLTGSGLQGPASLSFNEALLSSSHSLTTYWPLFWGRLGVARLAQVPSLLFAGLVLGPMVLLVCYRCLRARVEGWIVYPLLLWLALVATFLMPLSYDYNMIYFPLLIVAVWDRRDPWWVQVLLLPALLWWQPYNLNLPLQADVLNIAKLVSLAGVSACLLRRIGEAAAPATSRTESVTVPAA